MPANQGALLTLRAQGRRMMRAVTCKVETGRGSHSPDSSKCGGSGLELCSGDMLAGSLIACAGVSMRAAAAVSHPAALRSASAPGRCRPGGTLGIAADVPVGFKEIRLSSMSTPMWTPQRSISSPSSPTNIACIPDQSMSTPKNQRLDQARKTRITARSPASLPGERDGRRA